MNAPVTQPRPACAGPRDGALDVWLRALEGLLELTENALVKTHPTLAADLPDHRIEAAALAPRSLWAATDQLRFAIARYRVETDEPSKPTLPF